ncbi:hypothetical protein HYU12_03925 [Candidatus Woesearchaeota archaeon]|nr:hypothetical protein [Candidatus Woesearchaeota archaeon]
MVSGKKKLADVMDSLEYEELISLQKDLFNGGVAIRQLVNNKLREISAVESRVCATCGAQINLMVSNELSLIFGSSEAKRRVSFCAIDCMEYFTRTLKGLVSKEVESHVRQSQ